MQSSICVFAFAALALGACVESPGDGDASPGDDPSTAQYEPYFYRYEAGLLPHHVLTSWEGELDARGRKWQLKLALFEDRRFVALYEEYVQIDPPKIEDRVSRRVEGTWSIDETDRMVVGDIGLAVPSEEDLLFGFQRPIISPEIDGVATLLGGVWSNVGPEDWE